MQRAARDRNVDNYFAKARGSTIIMVCLTFVVGLSVERTMTNVTKLATSLFTETAAKYGFPTTKRSVSREKQGRDFRAKYLKGSVQYKTEVKPSSLFLTNPITDDDTMRAEIVRMSVTSDTNGS